VREKEREEKAEWNVSPEKIELFLGKTKSPLQQTIAVLVCVCVSSCVIILWEIVPSCCWYCSSFGVHPTLAHVPNCLSFSSPNQQHKQPTNKPKGKRKLSKKNNSKKKHTKLVIAFPIHIRLRFWCFTLSGQIGANLYLWHKISNQISLSHSLTPTRKLFLLPFFRCNILFI